MKRLILVYNPRSSQFARVEEEILARVRRMRGWQLGKYEIKKTNVDDNAARLAKILMDGDTVLAAGGDGTATIAMNACMLAEAETKLAVLPYGNFNDMASTLGTKRLDDVLAGKVVKAWPLEISVNERHWRYAFSYVTIGLFAESVVVFDEEKTRRSMQSGRRGAVSSWIWLARWYFAHKKQDFLPGEVSWNGKKLPKTTTDYVALNATRMAGAMRGKKWFVEQKRFASATARLGSFWRLCWLMGRSILYRVPGKETKGDVLEFDSAKEVMLQAEGEYARVRARKIEVGKAGRSISVIVK